MTISSISSRRSPSPSETDRPGTVAEANRPSTPPTEGLQDLSIKPRGASAASSSASMAPRRGAPVAAPVATATLPVAPVATRASQSASQRKPTQELKAELDVKRQHFDDCVLRVHAAPTDTSVQELMDAAERLLRWHSELPRSAAVRLLNDTGVKEICSVAFHALCGQTAKAKVLQFPLTEGLTKNERVHNKLFAAGLAHTLDLTPLITDSIDKLQPFLSLQEYEVQRAISQLSISACTVEIRYSEQARRAEQLRADAGLVTLHQFSLLDRRVQLAQWALHGVSGDFSPELKEAVLERSGTVRALAQLYNDIAPAIRSTAFGDAERTPAGLGLGGANRSMYMGHHLDRDSRQVLEAAIDRLQEFAVAVEDLRATLTEHSAPTLVHDVEIRDVLTQIAEDAWLMSSALRKRLEVDPEAPVPAPAAAPPAAPAGSRTKPRKSKAKARPQEHGSSVAGTATRPAAAPESREAVASAPEKQLVRSKLGTPMLLSAEEAAKATTAAEAMKQRLQNLDALLAIDVPAKQRALAHAREGVSPENGTYAVKEIIKEIGQITDAMKDCQTQLADPKERAKLVAPGQMPQVHAKTVELKNKLHQLEGLANAATKNIEVAELDHVKTYRLPKQAHVERMFREGHLASIDKPQALEGEPGTLFEVKLQPSALRNGATPAPIWLHIHTHAPVQAHQLAKLDDSLFAASHVKTNEERGRGRQWQNARAAEGYEHVQIHRGKVSPELCRELLGRG